MNSSPRYLALHIELHAARFHGRPEWPPSPARAFQALVAGASDRLRDPEVEAAFEWLEALHPPIIAAPRHVEGEQLRLYVPNNDLDAAAGDPERVGEIRAAKDFRPRLLQEGVPFVYLWEYRSTEESHAAVVEEVATGLYQFGRGIDQAYAHAERLDLRNRETLLNDFVGTVHTPSQGPGPISLACPLQGSFQSLERRHEAQSQRFRVEGSGRSARQVFVQPPKPRFQQVSYGERLRAAEYELRLTEQPDQFSARPIEDSVDVVLSVRDAVIGKLVQAGLDRRVVERVLAGRDPEQPTTPVPHAERVRLIPLPSIGHEQADPSIRRISVELNGEIPIAEDDIEWAFSGTTVGQGRARLVASDGRMLRRFAEYSDSWTTMTPVALPSPCSRVLRQPGAPGELARREHAIRTLRDSLRHAEIYAPVPEIEVSREPFGKGRPSADFGREPRFPVHSLWHARLRFERPIAGPILLGNGRYLGLGLFRPTTRPMYGHVFDILDGWNKDTPRELVLRALRRATLARYQDQLGPGQSLPTWVSGHTRDDAPAPDDEHLFFGLDQPGRRLLVIEPRRKRRGDQRLTTALRQLTDLRAGAAGRLHLRWTPLDIEDPLLRPGREWTSITPYRVLRHRDCGSVEDAIREDLRAACDRRGLPIPAEIHVRHPRAKPGAPLQAHVQLVFDTAIPGPLLLGRESHRGSGWFASRSPEPTDP